MDGASDPLPCHPRLDLTDLGRARRQRRKNWGGMQDLARTGESEKWENEEKES